MINLILAIICSSLITILFRVGENRISSKSGIFISNYLVCIILAKYYIGNVNLLNHQDGLAFAIGLGTISGILFLVSFLLLQVNIAKNGMVMSSLFMKLGVVIPVIVAILIFRESPKLNQLTGILLAIISIILINYGADDSSDNKKAATPTAKIGSGWLLILLLILGGVSDCMINVYDKIGTPSLSDNFLFYVFFAALISAVVLQLIQKKRISKWDIIFGAAIGIPNYYSSRFQLAALKTVPAVIVFPVYSVGTIVVISLVGLFFFSEKLERNKLIAIITAILALVLLNI